MTLMAGLLWCGHLVHAEPPKMTGTWTIEISFAGGETRSLQFEAKDGGKGAFMAADATSRIWDSGKPSEVKWAQANDRSVSFSGPMEFLIGNVGRDAGILEFKGKFETDDLIRGDVGFSPIVGDGPTRTGTFKAIRASKG